MPRRFYLIARSPWLVIPGLLFHSRLVQAVQIRSICGEGTRVNAFHHERCPHIFSVDREPLAPIPHNKRYSGYWQRTWTGCYKLGTIVEVQLSSNEITFDFVVNLDDDEGLIVVPFAFVRRPCEDISELEIVQTHGIVTNWSWDLPDFWVAKAWHGECDLPSHRYLNREHFFAHTKEACNSLPSGSVLTNVCETWSLGMQLGLEAWDHLWQESHCSEKMTELSMPRPCYLPFWESYWARYLSGSLWPDERFGADTARPLEKTEEESLTASLIVTTGSQNFVACWSKVGLLLDLLGEQTVPDEFHNCALSLYADMFLMVTLAGTELSRPFARLINDDPFLSPLVHAFPDRDGPYPLARMLWHRVVDNVITNEVDEWQPSESSYRTVGVYKVVGGLEQMQLTLKRYLKEIQEEIRTNLLQYVIAFCTLENQPYLIHSQSIKRFGLSGECLGIMEPSFKEQSIWVDDGDLDAPQGRWSPEWCALTPVLCSLLQPLFPVTRRPIPEGYRQHPHRPSEEVYWRFEPPGSFTTEHWDSTVCYWTACLWGCEGHTWFRIAGQIHEAKAGEILAWDVRHGHEIFNNGTDHRIALCGKLDYCGIEAAP